MQATIRTIHVPASQLWAATVLLVGVLAIAYGWFHPSKVWLYAGLIVTAGGCLTWIARGLARGNS